MLLAASLCALAHLWLYIARPDSHLSPDVHGEHDIDRDRGRVALTHIDLGFVDDAVALGRSQQRYGQILWMASWSGGGFFDSVGELDAGEHVGHER